MRLYADFMNGKRLDETGIEMRCAAQVIQSNSLALGFYTVPEAARLIEVGNAQQIYGWLKGYPGRIARPLLERDYTPLGGRQELSFLDLIEVRFVEHFRTHQVKMRALRVAAERLRVEFDTPHPFATDRVHLVADKADVFLAIMRASAADSKDRALMSLTTNNFVMEEMIKQLLVPGIEFDRKSRFARRWAPRAKLFPDITIDPLVAYGQPALSNGIPTAVLAEALRAENDNADIVADWYDVKTHDVLRAAKFEELLSERAKATT